jgi:phosphopantothenoylcysteine decarboxylase/phosphopantothenate--cysteine ligase
MKVLITAGPTREPIDPVRYLSNRSSGKMGYALAEAALEAGDEVVLISGPVNLAPPAGARLIPVVTADEMHDAVHAEIDGIDLAILCAAVADFKPAHVATHKIKKENGIASIELVPTRDILASLGAFPQKKFYLAGFAAETDEIDANAREKLRKKNCDAIVANDVSRPGLGFESDFNAATVFLADGSSRVLSANTKKNIAAQLVKLFHELQEKR